MTEEAQTPAAKPASEDGSGAKLVTGLFFVPFVPWFLFSSNNPKLNQWWVQLILGGFWLYALTSLVAGVAGLWALYRLKQSRENAIAYGDDKAAAAWIKIVMWGIGLAILFGIYGLGRLLFDNLPLGEALIVGILTGILVMLVVIWDQQIKSARR